MAVVFLEPVSDRDHGRSPDLHGVAVSYEVVSAVGATIFTSCQEDLARAWLQERRLRLPGAQVERVTTTIVRERVYKPRLVAE